MARSDRSYFQERAEAELAAACRASHPKAVEAHYQMASHYLDLANDPLPTHEAAEQVTRDKAKHGRQDAALAS